MFYELNQLFYTEAAHTLKREFGGEGSRRIHGHTYSAEVFVLDAVGPNRSGMLLGLDCLNAAINKVRDWLYQPLLDEVPHLCPAAIENLCAYIYNQLQGEVPQLVCVTLERPASGDKCLYGRSIH